MRTHHRAPFMAVSVALFAAMLLFVSARSAEADRVMVSFDTTITNVFSSVPTGPSSPFFGGPQVGDQGDLLLSYFSDVPYQVGAGGYPDITGNLSYHQPGQPPSIAPRLLLQRTSNALTASTDLNGPPTSGPTLGSISATFNFNNSVAQIAGPPARYPLPASADFFEQHFTDGQFIVTISNFLPDPPGRGILPPGQEDDVQPQLIYQGSIDNVSTRGHAVPTPGAASMGLALLGLVALRRRRRAHDAVA